MSLCNECATFTALFMEKPGPRPLNKYTGYKVNIAQTVEELTDLVSSLLTDFAQAFPCFP